MAKTLDSFSTYFWGEPRNIRDTGPVVVPQKRTKPARPPAKRKYTDEQVRAVRSLHQQGFSYSEIAAKLNATNAWVSSVLQGYIRGNVK